MRAAEDLQFKDRSLAGHYFERPALSQPGPAILFVHGQGSSQIGYLPRAKALTEQLGVTCLTFDLTGHGESPTLANVTARDHLNDCKVAFDALASHPGVDEHRIGVCGASYGGYLAALLSGQRVIARLLLRAPGLYADVAIDTPLDRRGTSSSDAAAAELFASLARSRADVLIVESEHDELIPHSVIEAYLRECPRAQHEILRGARHGLSETDEVAFIRILGEWFSAL
jgi:pimeloyl-ACP methyl ester carboxylesterase